MKLCSIIFILVNLILITSALPSKIFYYNGARSAPYKNGMMYIQYTQPRYRNIATGAVRAYSAGDTVATGTYVNPVDCNDEKHIETFAARVNLNEEKDTTTSVAEAYPPAAAVHQTYVPENNDDGDFEEQHTIFEQGQSGEQPQQPSGEVYEHHEGDEIESDAVNPQQPEIFVNRKDRTGGFDHQVEIEHVDDSEHFIPTTTQVSYVENDITIKNDVTTAVPPPAILIPVASAKPSFIKPNRPKSLPSLPKKKIQVRLDYPAVSAGVDEEQDDEEVYTHYNRVLPKPVYLPNRSPAPPQLPPQSVPSTEISGTSYAAGQSSNKKKNNQSSATPSGQSSFFPVYFGGDNGGSAIAIANSYSTGEGGSATSHAIAYGNPASSQLRHKKVHRAAPIRRQ